MRKVIEGGVDLSSLHLTELPDLSDVDVIGWVGCQNNNLTSLEGCPKTVGGSFFCNYNNLTSLEGIPKTIKGNFYIDKSLKDKFPKGYIRSLCKIRGKVVYV